MSNGNITFCSTVRLSKSADPWNNMPISYLVSVLSWRVLEVKTLSSIQYLARIRIEKTNHAFHQDSFTTSACTNDEVALPRFHNGAHILDNSFISKTLPDIFNFNHVGYSFFCDNSWRRLIITRL